MPLIVSGTFSLENYGTIVRFSGPLRQHWGNIARAAMVGLIGVYTPYDDLNLANQKSRKLGVIWPEVGGKLLPIPSFFR